jgi:hypothetical protein
MFFHPRVTNVRVQNVTKRRRFPRNAEWHKASGLNFPMPLFGTEQQGACDNHFEATSMSMTATPLLLASSKNATRPIPAIKAT